jgi:hypothetical protein
MPSKSNGSDGLLLVLAIIAVLVSLAGFLISMSVGGITGNQINPIDYGYVNVTVQSTVAIRMNVTTINFGAGAITPGQVVILESNTTPDGLGGSFNRTNVTKGGDGKVIGGLIIENYGNGPVSLALASNKDANAFICGGDSSCQTHTTPPQFQLMWQNNFSGSCSTPAWTEKAWNNAPTSSTPICTAFNQATNGNRLEINARLRLNDKTPGGATKGAIITFTAS